MLKKLLILAVVVQVSAPAYAQMVDTAWVRRYNGPADSSDEALAIAVDNSGNVYVTGFSIGSVTDSDYVTIKYYPNGDTAWMRRYNGLGNSNDVARAIAVDDSGDVYVCGNSYGSGTGLDYATIKYKPDGDTAWVRRYNGTGNGNDVARAIALDNWGNVYVTGSVAAGSSTDYATVKYDFLGNELWVKTYNGPWNSYDDPYAIAIDTFGYDQYVYVTGSSYSSTSTDYTTIKYDIWGHEVWVRRYDGGNGPDGATAITLADSGNIYVTGQSYGGGTGMDWATVKYQSSGDTSWVRRYNGPGNGYDDASRIALDRSGNVYVIGRSYEGGGNFDDWATIKYDSLGNQLWIRKYNGPGSWYDYPYAMALDNSGNVYVTGGSSVGGSEWDYATVKYKSNGDTAWVRRYDGPGNGNDASRAVALGRHGYVYVTGQSYGSGTSYDYATIKYSPKLRSDTLRFVAYSPVNLIVTDPVLDSIGIDFNTIPGAFYDTTQDINGDGDRDDQVIIPNPIMGEYMIRVVPESGGSGTYTLSVKLDGNEERALVAAATCPGPGQVDTVFYNVPQYLHGDVNRDGKKTVSDVVFLINYLFKGGPAPVPLDLGDCNFCEQNPPVQPGNPTVADVVYLVNYLFKAGLPPCS
jgi:hypothetical protein